MARRVRAEAKSLRRCAWGPSSDGISRPRPPMAVETPQLDVIAESPMLDPPLAPPHPPVEPVAVVELPSEEPVAGAPLSTALPVFAPAPSGAPMESVMVNAFAMVNPPPPWNAVAECRQQAERLAELESQILEECRLRQNRLFRAELQEKEDEAEQRWKKDFEAQIALLERRVMETRLSNQEAEMQMQQDARLRHQVVQERCNVLAQNLAEEQAEFNTKHFQTEQTVSILQAEHLQSQKEVEAVKLQESFLSHGLHEELAAEAKSARYVSEVLEHRLQQEMDENQRAQEALSSQQLQHREAINSFQEQRFELEERVQKSEHLQQMARRHSELEEDLARRSETQERQSQEKLLEIRLEKEDLASSVRVLTAEVHAAQEQVTCEHEQWQMLKLEVKEARAKQEGLLAEVHAAQDFAAEATNRAEAEQRERLRDLRDFQRILRQHQEKLDSQQRREIWEELQNAVCGTSDVLDFELPCEEGDQLDTEQLSP